MQLATALSRVDFCVSTSCFDPTRSSAWSLLRDFGGWGAFLHAFGDKVVQTSLLPGDQPLQIGARRVLSIGSGKLVEQLSAIDEDNKTMVYKLITHAANVNPFSASFVNYSCHVSVQAITMTKHSFIKMSGSFMTEPTSVEQMQFSLTCFHETCLRSLSHYMGHKDSLEPARSLPVTAPSGNRVGTWDLYSSLPQPPIGRSTSLHRTDHFTTTDRQNSSDSTRSQMEHQMEHPMSPR